MSTLFSIVAVALLCSASLFALIGHCVKGSKMLVASGLYSFGGEADTKGYIPRLEELSTRPEIIFGSGWHKKCLEHLTWKKEEKEAASQLLSSPSSHKKEP